MLAGNEIDEVDDLASERAAHKLTYATVTGATIVERRSIMTTKRIEKQQKPHSCSKNTSSARLWTVELIHRLRCESKTRELSGGDGLCVCIADKFGLVCGKMLEHQRGEVAILAEM